MFGDTEAAVVAILAAELADVTVSTDTRGYASPDRWVSVVRTGGVPTLWRGLDNAVIAVEAYAQDKGAALDLANAARAAVFAARGVYVGNGLAVYDVTDADGVTWKPDPDTDAARYAFSLTIVTRPA